MSLEGKNKMYGHATRSKERTEEHAFENIKKLKEKIRVLKSNNAEDASSELSDSSSDDDEDAEGNDLPLETTITEAAATTSRLAPSNFAFSAPAFAPTTSSSTQNLSGAAAAPISFTGFGGAVTTFGNAAATPSPTPAFIFNPGSSTVSDTKPKTENAPQNLFGEAAAPVSFTGFGAAATTFGNAAAASPSKPAFNFNPGSSTIPDPESKSENASQNLSEAAAAPISCTGFGAAATTSGNGVATSSSKADLKFNSGDSASSSTNIRFGDNAADVNTPFIFRPIASQINSAANSSSAPAFDFNPSSSTITDAESKSEDKAPVAKTSTIFQTNASQAASDPAATPEVVDKGNQPEQHMPFFATNLPETEDGAEASMSLNEKPDLNFSQRGCVFGGSGPVKFSASSEHADNSGHVSPSTTLHISPPVCMTESTTTSAPVCEEATTSLSPCLAPVQALSTSAQSSSTSALPDEEMSKSMKRREQYKRAKNRKNATVLSQDLAASELNVTWREDDGKILIIDPIASFTNANETHR